MNLKYVILITFSCILLFACKSKSQPDQQATSNPTGELAFLLQYGSKLPSDVGFLRNQVMSRRLGNIMKDSLQVFLNVAKYETPIEVDPKEQLITASFFSDSDRSMPSGNVIIDVKQDAIWVEYLSGDTIIEFTDHASLQKPGLVID